jgi:hypothetical protein
MCPKSRHWCCSIAPASQIRAAPASCGSPRSHAFRPAAGNARHRQARAAQTAQSLIPRHQHLIHRLPRARRHQLLASRGRPGPRTAACRLGTGSSREQRRLRCTTGRCHGTGSPGGPGRKKARASGPLR